MNQHFRKATWPQDLGNWSCPLMHVKKMEHDRTQIVHHVLPYIYIYIHYIYIYIILYTYPYYILFRGSNFSVLQGTPMDGFWASTHRVIRISVWHRIEPGVRHLGCFEEEFANHYSNPYRTFFFVHHGFYPYRTFVCFWFWRVAIMISKYVFW